jgi:hypothetical protein
MKPPSLKLCIAFAWTLAILSNLGISMGTWIPFSVWLVCQILGIGCYGKRALWVYLSSLVALIVAGAVIAYMIDCFFGSSRCVPL